MVQLKLDRLRPTLQGRPFDRSASSTRQCLRRHGRRALPKWFDPSSEGLIDGYICFLGGLLLSWEWFSVRVGIADLRARSAAEWSLWAQEKHKPVSFKIKNKWRTTVRAVGRLDSAHKQARLVLLMASSPADSVHGFVRKRNTRSAALPHVGASAVLAVDLKDFFGQVTFDRVAGRLHEHFDERVCEWIEGSCFIAGTLPFGFRTSPVLSNIAFHDMDSCLEAIARHREVTYTRWVDDLAFSGTGVTNVLLAEISAALVDAGWQLSERKTRFMRRSPYVLGLYVGHDANFPRLPRRMRQRLLLESYHFSKRGFEHFSHEGVLSPDRLFGQAAYAQMIDPALSLTLNRRIHQGYQVERRK